ncbi:MAG: hypothetical protein P8M30_18815 [Planctomycetaceae bacterium]|nr:hypothetical protein [Planctomycetaceae bacterium]
MPTLETLIFISGILHLGTLLGSAQVPRELNFREELPKVSPLLKHWILVAGGYVVLNIIAFGVISLTLNDELASGTPLARAFSAYVAIFWGCRLIVQFFVFDAKPYLRNWFLKAGYHGLTFIFAWHTIVFGYAALLPGK